MTNTRPASNRRPKRRRPGAPVRHSRPAGFTLIEAMVVVALLAIVAATAAPGFTSFIGTMNSKSAAFDLISDLTAARSEAIKRNANVTLAPITPGDWTQGWDVRANDGSVLRKRAALTSSLSVGGGVGANVVFAPNGRLANEITTNNQKWSISSTISGVTPRCIVITPTGAARSKPGAC